MLGPSDAPTPSDELRKAAMLFNMNNYIRVRLTDEGRAIHRRNHDALLQTLPLDAAEKFIGKA